MSKKQLSLVIAVATLLGSSSAMAVKGGSTAKASNTATNQRDQNAQNLTPTDQSRGSDADVELTRKIREQLTSDSSLSSNAHNIKVITLGGVTTLRGPVNSQSEKERVAQIAQNVVGANVRNELQIQSSDKK